MPIYNSDTYVFRPTGPMAVAGVSTMLRGLRGMPDRRAISRTLRAGARFGLAVVAIQAVCAVSAHAQVAQTSVFTGAPRIVNPRSPPDVGLIPDNPGARSINSYDVIGGTLESHGGNNENYSGTQYGLSYLGSIETVHLTYQLAYAKVELASQGGNTPPFDATHEQSQYMAGINDVFFFGLKTDSSRAANNGVNTDTDGQTVGASIRVRPLHLTLGYFQGEDTLSQFGGLASPSDVNLRRQTQGYGLYWISSGPVLLNFYYDVVSKDPFKTSFGDLDREDSTTYALNLFLKVVVLGYSNLTRSVDTTTYTADMWNLGIQLSPSFKLPSFGESAPFLTVHSEHTDTSTGLSYDSLAYTLEIYGVGERLSFRK